MDTFTQIEQTHVPGMLGHIRHEHRKVWAVKIRVLLRQLGIQGVSVTTPRHSMAQSIDIELPAAHDPSEPIPAEHEASSCPKCQRKWAAKERLKQLILSAYPDLNDKSEYVSDYFDYCLSIN